MRQIYFILMLLWSITSFGQSRVLSGTVSASDGSPLPGASVVIQGTVQGTSTDFDGKFSIEASAGDILEVSYIGFMTQRVRITDSDNYDIVLVEDAARLDEVVLTGYTAERKSDIAGAISIVKVEDAAQEFSPNILTALQGRVAGVQITSDGTPGGNGSQIAIRGLNSINASVGPLWVIDGVQTFNPSSLNPDEIDSIQVLKDGASVAIYGTSGANGVIVVTTKGAKSGVSSWNVKVESTVNMIRDRINLLNSREWVDTYYKAQLGAGI